MSGLTELIHIKEVIEPIAEWAEVYDKIYPFYINMYQHLDDDLKQFQTL